MSYELFLLEPRTCDNYGKIHFDCNTYSVSPKYARSSVYVKATSNAVYLLDKSYETIISHDRLYGKGKEAMNWLPYWELMSHCPGALKYTSFYNNLLANWRKYLNNQDIEGKRKGLALLHTMLQSVLMIWIPLLMDSLLDTALKKMCMIILRLLST